MTVEEREQMLEDDIRKLAELEVDVSANITSAGKVVVISHSHCSL